MPVYSYRCRDCGHRFEQRQRMTEDPLSVCPVCKGKVRRVVNSVGIVFKGSGFYITDNRNGSNPNGSSKQTSKKADSEEKKADTAPADSKKTSEKGEKVTAEAGS